MPEASQRYAAFVSYRHMPRDRQWAIRVMRALEAYRTPAPLKREAFPDRIGHLFRDEDEIPASSDLSDQIKEALARSDYLIVICSPDTPGSRWVRREIELFQEMGKGERIIPLLIAGEPDESFPAELRRRRVAREGAEGPEWEEVEPIAADVRRRGDERGARTERCALLRLAAALLGCRYDDLARRDDARRRAIWRARALAAACVLLGVAGGGVWWWDAYWRVKTEYCANYAERFGVPECVGEITGDGWQHQYRSFRLTLRAGRVLELARVNGSGTPTATPETLYEVEPWTEGVARWTFTYDGTLAGGWPRLSRVTMLAPNGRQIRETGYHFTAEGRQAVAGFDKGLGVAERQTAAGTTLGSMPIFGADTGSQHSNIGQHRLFFDAGGRLSRRLFEPVGGGANIADAAGAYGRAYTYTLQGLIAVTRNLDTRGETLIDRLGGAAIPRDYDPQGRLVAVTWQDAAGHPRANDQNVATVVYSRNADGLVEVTAYRDQAGALALRNDWDVARTAQRYDQRGNLIEQLYFGTDGRSILRKDIGAARTATRYDERGNMVEQTYFGTDGQPILDKDDGATRETWRYDGNGNAIETAYFGTDGQPTPRTAWGATAITSRYDEDGNAIEEAYFGTDGKPILREDIGLARETWRYDERGNAIEEAYFGADGQPILRKDSGAARTTWRYDERRNEVEQTFFGGDGKPILSRDFAAARVIRTYDEAATLVESETFDVAGLELRDWFAGDDEQKRGDYVAALARYTAGLTRIARGATQEPTNIRGQLALADIHDRIANTRQAMNDRAGAAQSLTAETEILLALTQHQLDATSRDDVTERLGNHSYVLLFIGEDKKALDTADVAIALAPDKRWILTNKAHALMFLDQTEAARALYLAPDNRGREMPDGNTWEADITNDFAELRKAGRTNPLMDEVLRAFVAPPPSETAPP